MTLTRVLGALQRSGKKSIKIQLQYPFHAHTLPLPKHTFPPVLQVAGVENTSQYCTRNIARCRQPAVRITAVDYVTYEAASNTTAPPEAKLV